MICTAVGGEGMFSGPVTARQICDITVMHCHGGLSLKAQHIEFQLNYCGQIFFSLVGKVFIFSMLSSAVKFSKCITSMLKTG